MQIRYLGHSAFELEHEGTKILIDPFLTGNPKAACAAADLEPDVILLTHGHADHIGDTVEIAKRAGSTVVAIVELAGEIGSDGVQDVRDPNLGGTVSFDWGSVKLVPAWHTSTTPKGTINTPAGLIIEFGGQTLYHLGDTCLFGDLELIGRRHEIDVALMCIGGHYTMDRFDAVEAVRMLAPRQVIPCHYNTFPPIETDAEAFAGDVSAQTGAEAIVLESGETHTP
jgi:L-ascorbate metabolism protein UlaG (beta-lactamase superfamily)